MGSSGGYTIHNADGGFLCTQGNTQCRSDRAVSGLFLAMKGKLLGFESQYKNEFEVKTDTASVIIQVNLLR